VLVKVEAAAICGTDLHVYEWNRWAAGAGIHLPRVMGHEFAGEVVEVGSAVRSVRKGDRVAGETHIPCGSCYQCRNGMQHICSNLKLFSIHTDGCFADYTLIPEECAYPLPAGMEAELGALFEPLGTSFRAVETAVPSGANLLVTGCGPIGLFAVSAARTLGAARIWASDVRPERLELARSLGADVVIDPRDGKAGEGLRRELPWGVDSVVECSGNTRAITFALQHLRKGGRLVLVGLPSEPLQVEVGSQLVFKEARVYGIHGREMFATWTRVMNLVQGGEQERRLAVEPVITHRLPLERCEEGFRLLQEGKGSKVILLP
jgi:threonine 3-dehydrogenase